jgi:hypothetical protein
LSVYRVVEHFYRAYFFSIFQGLEVICKGICHPIGAIRAHFKALNMVVLPKNLRTSGFFLKSQLNSRFPALNSPTARSRMVYFANQDMYRAFFHALFSYPRVSPSAPKKGIWHTGSFSGFQGLEVMGQQIRLPLGAVRAHFKLLKPVTMLKRLHTVGIF